VKVRRDASERAIVEALRKVGAVVIHVSRSAQRGAPDLFVAWRGSWAALECKSKDGRLSEEQTQLVSQGLVRVVRTPLEALEAIGVVG
jgi:Holliday junction resolvase